ncbi:thioredoxin reductase [Syncephalis pseudoplumigaleata]|uniref:thioredoxin-disulfide reductase (NADPH) n=1 Tax=Syncephalis pseudoplumigaleata TaxID=1712513 RepID=A0A4P9YYY9_9FUNG|nr:thioredoxin reductase [Syncephalis pseudoplumigaleata]|eukprot:RKP24792.1 thioredoxin reductase [Syncephalis pseudoplumigaleata]
MHTKVAIIGSGPAGHTAAIYCARANLEPTLFEGFMAGGTEMMDKLRQQSERFGTTVITETISKVDLSAKPFKLWREGNEAAEPDTADAIIIATGATARRMNLPGEETYWQQGISACAVCDGAAPIFRNVELAVVGGGDSAAEEAIYLTKYASKVHVLVRRDKLRASKVMGDRMLRHPKIQVHWNTVATEARGDGKLLKELGLRDTQTGEERSLAVNGLFYAIGHVPNTAFLEGQLPTDTDGYLLVTPGTSKTSVPGVFAGGDVQDKRYRQAVTAAGSGCMAALDAITWLEEQSDV